MWKRFLLTFLLLAVDIPFCDTLYTNKDAVDILTSSSFRSDIFSKPFAIVVEFYNSWCGHCIRFAPVWKKFAGDTIGE